MPDMQFNTTPELRKRLKIACIERDENISVIVNRALVRELDRIAAAPVESLPHAIARRRDYSGRSTMLGALIPLDLASAVRRYCAEHRLLIRHFVIDALRRHLRLVLRGGPHVSDEATAPPERRIVTS